MTSQDVHIRAFVVHTVPVQLANSTWIASFVMVTHGVYFKGCRLLHGEKGFAISLPVLKHKENKIGFLDSKTYPAIVDRAVAAYHALGGTLGTADEVDTGEPADIATIPMLARESLTIAEYVDK